MEYRICTFDGSDIYKSELDKYNYKLSLLTDDGRPDYKKFNTVFDNSLDIQHLRDVVYPKHSKEMKGKHLLIGIDKKYTTAIINVTFKHSIKEFEHRGGGLYCVSKEDFDRSLLNDHIYINEDGELVAIEVINEKGVRVKNYEKVKKPILPEEYCHYFEYDENECAYKVLKREGKKESKIKTDVTSSEIRDYLYENGFSIDGVKYVRYKRSAGSGREGACLFIAKPLYEDMMKWSSCGLDAKEIKDRSSWEAYISLTLSDCTDIIDIPKKAIMLLRDVSVGGEDEVISVSRGDSMNGETVSLEAERRTVEYKNKIWDGEALLDESIFAEYDNRSIAEHNGERRITKHGMMLLRNRMFKTCAFRTGLQRYFKDHEITLDKLGGYAPYAEGVEDIKLVVTESSVKYIKLKKEANPELSPEDEDAFIKKAFKEWLDIIYSDRRGKSFGIVKTDKKSGPMENKCVYTNYQLLNTLSLNASDTDLLLEDSFDFLKKIETDPVYLRYQYRILAARSDDTSSDDDGYIESHEEEHDVDTNYRFSIIKELISRSDRSVSLPIYKDYLKDTTDSFKKRIKNGRIIIEGNYSTLFGNPLEFLKCAADKNYTPTEPLALCDGEIYTRRFEDGKTLLCSRSPHITMGNVLVAKNKYVKEIDEYFCLGDADTIVCVNAIKSNIMQRLNGCDYDSDTMLITDNPIMLSRAVGHSEKFPVPHFEDSSCPEAKTGAKEHTLCELDVKISNNKIGEIVNLSQFLNSLYWDSAARGMDDETLEEIYMDICKLAVLSGIEIDKAKRDLHISSTKILDKIRKKHKRPYIEENNGLPRFFTELTSDNNSRVKPSPTAELKTPMSYIFDAVASFKDQKTGTKDSQNKGYLDFFGIKYPGYDQGAKRRGDNLYNLSKEVQAKLTRIKLTGKKSKGAANYSITKERTLEVLKDALIKAGKFLKGESEYWYALYRLDNEKTRNSILLYLICFANDMRLIKSLPGDTSDRYQLLQDDSISPDDDCVMIYGHPHKLKLV